jgi:Flp pilus assembly protein TadD
METRIADRDRSKLRGAAVIAAGLVAVLVYANSLANGFAYDDQFVVQERELIQTPVNLPELLTAEYWPESYASGLYRPLTLLSFATDWKLWGGRPVGFHLTNILLHAAVSALVAALLLSVFSHWAALAGGLVFAVHSVHTEAVANIVGRGELLAALFVLSACLLYVGAVRRRGLNGGVIALISLAYGLACFSKEVGVVLPALLVTTDVALQDGNRRLDVRGYLRSRLPLFVALAGVLAIVLAVRWAVLGAPLEHQPAGAFALDDSFRTRFLTMSRVWPRYLELLFFPYDLSADYSPAVVLPVDRFTLLGAAGLFLALATVALAAVTLRRAPVVSLALVWAGIALLPVSNLIVVAEITLAERTLYLPSVAVAFLAAAAVAVTASGWRRVAVVSVAIWIVGFAAVTIQRNPVWRSTNSVFEDLRRKHPESSRLLFGVGYQYYRVGRWREAREWFRRSIEIWPHNATHRADFAVYLAEYSELQEADSMAAGAVDLRPGVRDYHVLLASLRLREGEAGSAVEVLDRALAIVGDDASLHTLRASAFVQLDALDQAIRAQERAVETRAGGPYWLDLLGLAQMRVAAGDTAGALRALRQARTSKDAKPEVADSLVAHWTGLR